MYLLSLLPLFVYICDVNSKCVKEEKMENRIKYLFLVLFHSFLSPTVLMHDFLLLPSFIIKLLLRISASQMINCIQKPFNVRNKENQLS